MMIDPVSAYQLGRLRHQEILDEMSKVRGERVPGGLSVLWTRIRAALSDATRAKPATTTTQHHPNVVATSR